MRHSLFYPSHTMMYQVVMFHATAYVPILIQNPDIPLQLGTHPVDPTFIRRARRFLSHLEGPILTFSAVGNPPVLSILQECAILVNTALLNVYIALARHGYDEGSRKGVAALVEIVSITKTLRPEELDCLDPLVVASICLTVLLRSF
jgi:hypothetical protein